MTGASNLVQVILYGGLVALAAGCRHDSSTADGGSDADPDADTDADTDTGPDTDTDTETDGDGRIDGGSDGGSDSETIAADEWYAGTFRHLPALSGDIVEFVGDLEHPNVAGYVYLSPARRDSFAAFQESLFTAISETLIDPNGVAWCSVLGLAGAAGYELLRFHDTGTGRWFVYGRDATSDGQAYFFVNPEAKRDLVVESPHVPYDWLTDVQGIRIFLGLAARALLLNKEHRCSDPDVSSCDGTGPCDDTYRESDVAHHPLNTFHMLHRWFVDAGSATRLVQLHGMEGDSTSIAEVGDGSTSDLELTSVSVLFADNLDAYVPDPTVINSCQQYAGDPPFGLCGTTNLQGRYANNPTQDECTEAAGLASGRFLHIEQSSTLRDDDDSDGYFWGDTLEALRDTWPECELNDGPIDCTLGPSQGEPLDLACD